MDNDQSISLNKFISSKGLCSRRQADEWIEKGVVAINGVIAKKGNRVEPGDEVTINGEPIKSEERKVYLKFHKPAGVTCTTDKRDRDNIIDYINFKQRIFPIGRLDKNSTGLILLTNDGDIVNKILRREHRHEKEYIVSVDKPITNRFLNTMSQPIPILGTKTLPCQVSKIARSVFRIVLTQGLNRQIRRMCEYCNYKVLTLKRVRIMHILLDDLKPGEWRHLNKSEYQQLMAKIQDRSK